MAEEYEPGPSISLRRFRLLLCCVAAHGRSRRLETSTGSAVSQRYPGQDFNRLWGTVFGRGHDRLSLVIFDAPRLGGEEFGQRPWHERRSALQAAVPVPGAAISVIDAFDADPVVHERLLALLAST